MNNEKWLNECKPGEIRSLTSSDGSSATIVKLEADRSELEAANSVIANLKLTNEKLLARISELNEGRSQSPDEIRRTFDINKTREVRYEAMSLARAQARLLLRETLPERWPC